MNFLAFFDGFLDVPTTRTFNATLISVKMKGVEVVHIWAKFHTYMMSNSGVLIFEKLS